MSGITHEWNGTVLTITSDSGTSSADLKGDKGDTGIRGAQGYAGKDANTEQIYTVMEEFLDKKLDKTAQSVDSALLSGKSPEYFLQPRNLLDNGDFRKPVNQRAKSKYNGKVYGLDRWKGNTASTEVNVEDGHIRIVKQSGSTSTGTLTFIQLIEINETNKGKQITLVANVKGNGVRTYSSIKQGNSYGNYEDWTVIYENYTIPTSGDTFYVGLQGTNSGEFMCEWVALYEGKFTAKTIPPYVSKGYSAELTECQRYYITFGDMIFRSTISENPIHNINITFPVPMRVIPNITATAREGEVPETYSAYKTGVAYSVYGAKYSLQYICADADLD